MKHSKQPPLTDAMSKTKATKAKQHQRKATKSTKHKKSTGKKSQIKRTIKYLSSCRNPKTCKAVLGDASDGVIKCICNAALNAYKGDVRLTGPKKRLFAKHRGTFNQLINPSLSIKSKRKLLVQKGGIGFLPLLLTSVLGSIGSSLFSSLVGNKQQQQQQQQQ